MAYEASTQKSGSGGAVQPPIAAPSLQDLQREKLKQLTGYDSQASSLKPQPAPKSAIDAAKGNAVEAGKDVVKFTGNVVVGSAAAVGTVVTDLAGYLDDGVGTVMGWLHVPGAQRVKDAGELLHGVSDDLGDATSDHMGKSVGNVVDLTGQSIAGINNVIHEAKGEQAEGVNPNLHLSDEQEQQVGEFVDKAVTVIGAVQTIHDLKSIESLSELTEQTIESAQTLAAMTRNGNPTSPATTSGGTSDASDPSASKAPSSKSLTHDNSPSNAGKSAGSSSRAAQGASWSGDHWTVGPGDTLSAIAKHTLGRSSSWRKIWEANKATVANPDLIYPGQVLVIPR